MYGCYQFFHLYRYTTTGSFWVLCGWLHALLQECDYHTGCKIQDDECGGLCILWGEYFRYFICTFLPNLNDGSGDGKTNFKNMAAPPAGRTNFIKEVMNVVRQNNLDGIDMDWEFPTTTDGTDLTFTAMMKELSDSLHRDGRYYLSCAVTAGKYAGGIRDAIRNELFTYVDFFNIMAYDDFSTSAPYRHHSDYALAQTCLNYWLTTRGMPAAKAVLGLPAYGRPSGITQSGTILTYSGILGQGGNPQYDSAVVTSGSFVNYTIYYNGQYTIKRKAKLAKDIANGVMLWEKGQDVHDANSLLKAACDTVGRAY